MLRTKKIFQEYKDAGLLKKKGEIENRDSFLVSISI